jgi:hypothetical protein
MSGASVVPLQNIYSFQYQENILILREIMKTYKKSHKKLISEYVGMLALLAMGSVILYFALFAPNMELSPRIVAFVTGLVITPLSIYQLLDYFKYRLTISETQITEQSIFKRRTLSFDEIKGFIVTEKHAIRLEPKGYDKKAFRIENQIEDCDEILNLLAEKITMLEDNRKLDVLLEPSGDPNQMARFKMLSWTINVLAAASFGLSFYYAEFLYVLILSPLITILLDKYFGMPVTTNKKGQIFYNVRFTFSLIVTGVLCLAVMKSYRHLSLSGTYWLYVLVFFVILCGFTVYSYLKPLKGLIWTVFIPLFLIHSIVSVWLVNCMMDKPVGYYTDIPVLEKKYSIGKSTSYYLTVRMGEHRLFQGMVSYSAYKKVNKGDLVRVQTGVGKLGLPWYEIIVE